MSGINIDIDDEKIQKAITDKIINSAIGDKIVKAIEGMFETSYGKKDLIKEAIGTVANEVFLQVLREEYKDKIVDIIKKKLDEEDIVEKSVEGMILDMTILKGY